MTQGHPLHHAHNLLRAREAAEMQDLLAEFYISNRKLLPTLTHKWFPRQGTQTPA